MASKDAFRDLRKLGRIALVAQRDDEIQSAIQCVTQALRSRKIVGQRAKSLRGIRRALMQKLPPVV